MTRTASKQAYAARRCHLEKFTRKANIVITFSGGEKLSEEDKHVIALQAEQKLNDVGYFEIVDGETNKATKVGVRVHIK